MEHTPNNISQDGTQDDDLILLTAFKTGDVQAFNALFRRHHRFLKIEAYYRLRDMELAETAVNDVFLSIWMRRLDITINVPVKAYLFKAVVINCVEKKRNLKPFKKIIKHVDQIEVDHGFDPATMENKELGQKIFNAIAHISTASSRKAFSMQFIDRKPQKEIAQEMNLSLDAVKKKISRAAQEVRAILKKDQ